MRGDKGRHGREPRTSGRRVIANAIPVVLIALLAAELIVRAAAPKLRDPLIWPDWEAQNKVAAMDRLAEAGGASVVFVGSSMVNAGINPREAARMLGVRKPAFNAALNGSDLRSIDAWTRNVVVPRLRPRVVVIGFNAGEANDNRTATDLYDRFGQSPLGRVAIEQGGLLARVDAWFVERAYLIRYRSVLRNPIDAVIGHDPQQDRQRSDAWGRLAAIAGLHRRPYNPGLARNLGNFDRMFADFTTGGVQFDALERTIRSLKADGVGVVLVRMPITKDILPRYPRGESDRSAFTQVLTTFAARMNVPLIDAEAEISSPSFFVDPVHLNAEGMAMLTRIVAEGVKNGS